MSKLRLMLILAAVGAIGGVAAGCGGGDNGTATTTPPATTAPATTTAETTSTETTTGATGNAMAGKTIFTGTCGGCHTLADAGTSGTVGPNLDNLKPDFARVQRKVIDGSAGGGPMPAFGKQGILNDTQIADVATYVSSVAGK